LKNSSASVLVFETSDKAYRYKIISKINNNLDLINRAKDKVIMKTEKNCN